MADTFTGHAPVEAPRELPATLGSRDGLFSLAEMSDGAVVLYDPSSSSRSIAGITAGFQALTGYAPLDLRLSTREALLRGVPDPAVSRSAQKNFVDFCQTCMLPGVQDVAQSSSVHAFSRKDGSMFSCHETLGLCSSRQRRCVAVVHIWLAEGLASPRLPAARCVELKEQARQVLGGLRQLLRRSEAPTTIPVRSRLESAASRGPTFFSKRLQERCILFEGARSAARREPEELPVGCMLFGSTLMRPTQDGLRFSLRVDAVSKAFEGLPLLGFTRRRPADEPGLHPEVARCLGRSVLVGGSGEAFARDKEEHFRVGFKKIPQSEVASWCMDPEVPVHMRRAPVRPQVGDTLECRYTLEGRIQYWLNSTLILDFDTGRAVEVGGAYWPVIDVCHSVAAVTMETLHALAVCYNSSSEISTDDGYESPFDCFRDLEDADHEGKDDWPELGLAQIQVVQETCSKPDGTQSEDTAAQKEVNRFTASSLPKASMGTKAFVGIALVAVILAIRNRR